MGDIIKNDRGHFRRPELRIGAADGAPKKLRSGNIRRSGRRGNGGKKTAQEILEEPINTGCDPKEKNGDGKGSKKSEIGYHYPKHEDIMNIAEKNAGEMGSDTGTDEMLRERTALDKKLARTFRNGDDYDIGTASYEDALFDRNRILRKLI